MDVPIIVCPVAPGNFWYSADLPVLNNIFNADKTAITPKSSVSILPSTRVTNQLPTNTPIRINTAQRLSRTKSTLPF